MRRRPGYNTIRHWSPDHQWLAACIAGKVIRRFYQSRYVVPDDLINSAWLRALRFRRQNELAGCGTVLARTMHDCALTMLTGRNWNQRKRYSGEIPVESEPECNPIELMAEQEECEYIMGLLADDDRMLIQTLYGIGCRRHSERQIAASLGITRQGVNLRKQRILKRLRAKVA
jgi:DNA-directed RNA polymerase specialized sigma24 family protein